MKRILTIGLFLISSNISNAQADTSQIEQYCKVIAKPKLFSNKVTINSDFGEEKSFLGDTRLKTGGSKIRNFNTIIDALNYMGR